MELFMKKKLLQENTDAGQLQTTVHWQLSGERKNQTVTGWLQ